MIIDQACINVAGLRITVHENSRRSGNPDGFSGPKKGVGRRDDLVPRSDAEGHEGQPECVRARVHAHRFLGAAALSEFLLELLEPGTHDITATLQNLVNNCSDLVLQVVILADVTIKPYLDRPHVFSLLRWRC
jgi:hypothetical protein